MLLAGMLVVFFGTLFLGVPMAFSVGLASAFYIIFSDISPIIFAQQMYVGVSSFSLIAIPLFCLSGDLMNTGGLTKRLVNLAKAMVGHWPGSLAQVCVLACAMFGAMSGSAVAACTCMGAMLIPLMKEEGYDEGYACAVTAAAALLGPMIPPAISVVLYGSITQTPIPKLLMAGLAPAILMIVGFCATNHITAKRRHYKTNPKMPMKERLVALKEAIPALIAPLIIMGGILSGVFNATEAGAVAAIYALVAGIVMKELTWKDIQKALVSTTRMTATVMLINGMASVFSWVLVRENIPTDLTNAMLRLCATPLSFLMVVIVILLILGCFLTNTAITAMIAPLFHPIALMYGMNGVHFGTLFHVMTASGALTPPVGTMLFVAAKVGDTPMKKIIKNLWPFIGIMLLTAIIIAAFPDFSIFFGNLAK